MEENLDIHQSPPGYPPSPPTSGLAIGSLISSILSFAIMPVIGAILGLVLGYVAKRQIRDGHGAIGGDGLASAGIILGWIHMGLMVMLACLYLTVTIILPILSFGGIGLCALLAPILENVQ